MHCVVRYLRLVGVTLLVAVSFFGDARFLTGIATARFAVSLPPEYGPAAAASDYYPIAARWSAKAFQQIEFFRLASPSVESAALPPASTSRVVEIFGTDSMHATGTERLYTFMSLQR